MDIDCGFPGGNIVVESIDGDEVRVYQDLRDTDTDWFYWCFRVRGAEGRDLRFTFTQSRAIGVRGPAMSLDHGRTWQWLGSDVCDGTSFTHEFPADASDVRFSFAMPYQQEHWERFVEGLGENVLLQHETLCVTRKGREAELLLFGNVDGDTRHRMAITCRHHCCEMMVNYLLEGLIKWLLDTPEAEWLRKHVEFFIVPFVDKDGVEDGDQGKGRRPRDHGRDYQGESVYASTKAIRERLPEWGNGCLHVGLDLHCPHISGSHNEATYIVGSSNERIAEEQKRFSAILESVVEGILPFSARDYLPFGEAWNVETNYADGKGFRNWVSELPEIALEMTIELPYANAGGVEINQESARLFGADLGRALAEYLQTLGPYCLSNQRRQRRRKLSETTTEAMTREEQLVLIEKARNGDHEAFNELISRYHQPLVGYCATFPWIDAHKAKDVAQAVWRQAWLDMGKHPRKGGFDPERGTTFYTYLRNRYARFFVKRYKPTRTPPLLGELDENAREPLERESQSWGDKCLTAKEEARLRAGAFEAALRIVMHCGGYPHQQVAFCLSKALYGKVSPRGIEGSPAKINREYGAIPLFEAFQTFLHEYAKDTGMHPGTLDSYSMPVLSRMSMTVGDLMCMDHVSAKQFGYLSGRKVGETCMNEYYGQKSFTTAIPDWCYRVQNRVRSLLVFQNNNLMNVPGENQERPGMCRRCKLRQTPPCQQEVQVGR